MATSRYTSNTRRNTLARRAEYTLLHVRRFMRRVQALRRPVNQKMVIFDAFNGRSYCCSPKAIYETMKGDSRFDEFIFVWVFRDPSKYEFLKRDRTSLVAYQSKEYYTAYAVAGTWIINAMIPLDIPKRRSQTLVQCSHGTPLKRLRADVVKDTKNVMDSYDDMIRKNKIDTVRYDYFVSPSRFTSSKFRSAFLLEKLGKDDIILETGYPRNDALHSYSQKDAEAIKKRLKIPKNKKVILYAPTWRDDQFSDEEGFTFKPPVNFEYLKETLSDEYVILYRAHYLISESFDFTMYKNFIFNVSAYDDINDLYIISDVLVTDYSSVFFDFANLQRPILFFMYDKEHYKNDLRGLYLPFDALPGDIVTTEDQLVERLGDIENYTKKSSKRLAEFSKEYNYLDDGHASERVIAKVFPKT